MNNLEDYEEGEILHKAVIRTGKAKRKKTIFVPVGTYTKIGEVLRVSLSIVIPAGIVADISYIQTKGEVK